MTSGGYCLVDIQFLKCNLRPDRVVVGGSAKLVTLEAQLTWGIAALKLRLVDLVLCPVAVGHHGIVIDGRGW